MKYEVLNTIILTPGRTFRQGEVVTEKDFKDAGSEEWKFMVDSGAVGALKGTEDATEPPAVDPISGTDPVPPGTTPDSAAKAAAKK